MATPDAEPRVAAVVGEVLRARLAALDGLDQLVGKVVELERSDLGR